MTNENGDHILIRGESLGGGKARICRINDVEVDFTGGIQYLDRDPER